MERREQVFVSSTYVDLKEERQAVIQTLLQADCLPAGMELFPASDDEKWDLIKRVIDDSDYYVVMIGGKYGSTADDGLSFTEKEFDYAVEIGKPVMGFIHGSPDAIPVGKAEKTEDAQERLDRFKAKVEKRMVKYWTSPADLAGAVALALIQTRKTHPAEGWIRASHALTPEVAQELAELRAKVATMEREAETRESAVARAAYLDELAQGDDAYLMQVLVRYWSKEDARLGRTGQNNRLLFLTEVSITWNELFFALGPLMMNEAPEKSLGAEIDTLCHVYLRESVKPFPEDFGKLAAATAGADVVHDVKVQFYSLGLIRESDRRHPVQDHNNYWTLTSEGRAALLRLRAIRRKPSSPASS